MLETKDRDHLEGRTNYPRPESAYRRERELTDRVYGALEDFRYLQKQLTSKNDTHGRVWGRLCDPDPTAHVAARDGMAAAIALFYEIHTANDWDFEDTLRRAIEGAYSYGGSRRDLQHRVVEDVSLDIETHAPAPIGEVKDRIQRKLQNGERLTTYEYGEAAKWGDRDVMSWLQEYDRKRRKESSREDWMKRTIEDIEQFDDEPQNGE